MRSHSRILTAVAAFLLLLALATSAFGREAESPVAAALTDANITRLTAGLLGRSQFAHHPLDDQLAAQFLQRYLDALDTDHSLFLRSDVAEFAAMGTGLARETRRTGNVHVAHAIFDRFVKRLEQRTAYVTGALQAATFDFTGNSSYSLDRRHSPRPGNLEAARELWKQRLRVDFLQEKLDGKPADQIVKTLSRRANRLLTAMRTMSRDSVLEIYLSALARVYDPHSDYLGHEQLEEFAISMNLSLFGIGAKLQSEDGRCRIVELLAGGPAARSGRLRPGDRIVAVAQDGAEPVDIVDLPLSRAVKLIRGPKGTVVSLTIVPASAGDDGVRRTVSLVRDEIKLEDRRAKARIVDLPHGAGETLRLGVIDLPSFYSDRVRARSEDSSGDASQTSATADVARLLEKLKAERVRGIVLDLRRNGGGSLEEAISLTGLFIAEGPVVQTRGPGGDVEVDADTDPSVVYGGPLVVLTSAMSASASEILAGALQDYGRAIIVGDPSTYGKGTVQSVVPLAPIMDRSGLQYSHDPGALTVTIRKFYRPSGASTQLKGVVADIVLPSLSSRSDVGESVLENPLPWDSIAPARYDSLGMVQSHLATLREASARRVANDVDFAYLRSEIARLTQKLADRTVSLNEAQRRQERAALERRRKQHEDAVRALNATSPIIYEIPAARADRPGLPAPLALATEGGKGDAGGTDTGADSGEPDAQLAQRDVIMNETQKILAGYVSLLARDAAAGPRQAQVRAAEPAHVD